MYAVKKELEQVFKDIDEARFIPDAPPATDREMLDLMKKQAEDELDELNEMIHEKNPTAKDKDRLPAHMVANLMHKHIPMFKTDDSNGALIYLYSFDSGIYDSNTTAIQYYAQGLYPSYKERDVHDVQYSLQRLSVTAEPEDDPYLIPVANGVFNLQTKQLLPFDPKYKFIAKIATNYNPQWLHEEPTITTSNGNVWKPSQFIHSLASEDKEISQLLYEVIADSINGNFSHRQAIFLVGSAESLSANGSNGKGTFQELIINICGLNNVAQLKVDDMKERFMASELRGKTCDIGDDLQAGTYIDNSATFNSAVTGDVLHTDVKNRKPVTFRFKGAVIQSTNDMPRFKNKTGGTYRRVVIVPFNATFKGDNDNIDIKNDYITRKAVCEWFVVKALSLGYFKKFSTPRATKEALAEYKLENDQVRQFVEDVFYYNEDDEVRAGDLYEQYKTWCDDNGYKQPVSQPAFTKSVKGILNEKTKKKTGLTAFELKDLLSGKNRISDVLNVTELAYQHKNVRYGDEVVKCFVFPLRKLVADYLNLAKHLPKNDSPEYEKRKAQKDQLEKQILIDE